MSANSTNCDKCGKYLEQPMPCPDCDAPSSLAAMPGSDALSKLEDAAMMVLHGKFAGDAEYRESKLFEVLRESGRMTCNDHGQMVIARQNGELKHGEDAKQ